MEPESLELGLTLSDATQAAVEDVKARVLSVLSDWNVTASPVNTVTE